MTDADLPETPEPVVLRGDEPVDRGMERKSRFFYLEHLDEDGGTLNWNANWESIFLCIYAPELGKSENLYGEKRGVSGGDFVEFLKPDGEFESILGWQEFGDAGSSDADAEELRQLLYNKAFSKEERTEISISGSFSLSDDSHIGVLEDGKGPSRFGVSRRGSIRIHASGEDSLGMLSIIGESDLKWSGMDGVEEGELDVDVYMPLSSVQRIAADLKDHDYRAHIIVRLRVLAFRSEMDRSLSEPWHSTTYYLEKREYRTYGDAIVESAAVVAPVDEPNQPAIGYRDALEEQDESQDHGQENSSNPDVVPNSQIFAGLKSIENAIRERETVIFKFGVGPFFWALIGGLIVLAIYQF
ncbi:hypothetical protein [Nisaea sp.]|uniref:hypothetical protein n=1 Tax=Nisaea sp. TaxID=2024842 RepID=UPI0032EBCF65